MPIEPFKALLIEKQGDGVSNRLATIGPERLDPGEVTIKVHYSSINYKDALAATGAGKIIRRFPCIGGIDMAGEVLSSDDPRFAPGEKVIATSYDIGVSHHGGYAGVARVPARWVVRLPDGLTLHEAMALGTAGFTAGLGIQRMEDNGLRPGNGPVVVTGATGGVGSLAVNMLARLGYQVTALTSKASEQDYLRRLGAAEVRLTAAIDHAKVRPLEAGQWAGAVDNLGGPILHWVLATCQQGAPVASIGNAASAQLDTTVFPFILRGVSLLGVDSGYIGMPTRARVWARLAGELKPSCLPDLTRTIALEQLPAAFDDFLQGRIKGRTVVALAG